MSNLSQAIIEARKRHEAEIEARLRRRKERQENQLKLLNQKPGSGDTLPDTDDEDSEGFLPPPPAPVAPKSVSKKGAESPGLTPPSPKLSINHPPEIIDNKADYRPTSVPQYNHAEIEKETSPSSNFTKVSNIVIDGLKRHLSSTYFSVYVEIYRQTIGRSKSGAWLRTRDIQKACGLGSDTTVRKAISDLEEKGLIRLEKNRRVGSPKGLYICVLSVEKVLPKLDKKLDKQQSNDRYFSTEVPHQEVPQYFSKNYLSTSAFSNEVHDNDKRHEDMKTSSPAGFFESFDEKTNFGDDDVSIETTMALLRNKGLSPSAIPALLQPLDQEDFKLIPYLVRQLEGSIQSKQVKNPAGLLRVWLESFDSWRPQLLVQYNRDREAEQFSRSTREKTDLTVEWFEYVEETVSRLRKEMNPREVEKLSREARKEIEKLSPASVNWNEEIWNDSIEGWIRRRLETRVKPFEVWKADREA